MAKKKSVVSGKTETVTIQIQVADVDSDTASQLRLAVSAIVTTLLGTEGIVTNTVLSIGTARLRPQRPQISGDQSLAIRVDDKPRTPPHGNLVKLTHPAIEPA